MRKKLKVAVVIMATAFPVCAPAASEVSLVGIMVEKGFTPVKLTRARNHVFADCTVNGRRLDLGVDTGAGHTVISKAILSSLGGPTKKIEGNVYGMMGLMAKSTEATEVGDFQVGSYKAGAHPVRLWDFSRQRSPAAGMKMDGLLGIDFLHRHQAVLDCFQMNLFLKSPTAPSTSATLGAGLRAGGCTEVQLQAAGSGLIVPVRIDGVTGYLIVDTGAPWTLLRENAIAKLNLRRASAGVVFRGGSAFGRGVGDASGRASARLGVAYFNTMEIGSFSVPPQGVGVADIPGRGGGPGVFFGYLGQDLLAYYVGVIDCKALKLYLKLDPAIEAERKKRHT